MCRSRRELSNEYLLAKIGVDTAENEPLEVWGQNSIHYSFASLIPSAARTPQPLAFGVAGASVSVEGFFALASRGFLRLTFGLPAVSYFAQPAPRLFASAQRSAFVSRKMYAKLPLEGKIS